MLTASRADPFPLVLSRSPALKLGAAASDDDPLAKFDEPEDARMMSDSVITVSHHRALFDIRQQIKLMEPSIYDADDMT
jgi:hypothetical protein